MRGCQCVGTTGRGSKGPYYDNHTVPTAGHTTLQYWLAGQFCDTAIVCFFLDLYIWPPLKATKSESLECCFSKLAETVNCWYQLYAQDRLLFTASYRTTNYCCQTLHDEYNNKVAPATVCMSHMSAVYKQHKPVKTTLRCEAQTINKEKYSQAPRLSQHRGQKKVRGTFKIWESFLRERNVGGRGGNTCLAFPQDIAKPIVNPPCQYSIHHWLPYNSCLQHQPSAHKL